jgi:hypothetical protein
MPGSLQASPSLRLSVLMHLNMLYMLLDMHRLLRWLVGALASLLGLSLLLVRAGFWATGSTVVEDAQWDACCAKRYSD